ncbi:MAG: hypothetical protein K0S41_3006 [Anaerocolumna sp.]|nr:hypothetical protein [Anaerocolumna sp.]
MNKLKKTLLCLLIIFCPVAIIGIWFLVHSLRTSETYTITPEKSQIENAILERINRPTIETKSIDIIQELNLDNKKYVIIAFDKNEGYAEFTKGRNNKYKIGEVRYGDSVFSSEIKETNKGKYIFIICKNQNHQALFAKVQLDNKEYEIDISQEKYGIAYCKVPNSTNVRFINIENIKFYDNNNIDITADVLLNE